MFFWTICRPWKLLCFAKLTSVPLKKKLIILGACVALRRRPVDSTHNRSPTAVGASSETARRAGVVTLAA